MAKDNRSHKERMIGGEFYNPMDRELLLARTRARMLADKFNRTRAWNIPTRTRIIKKLFPNGAEGAFFEPNIRTEYGFNVRFGKNFYMNFDCQLLDVAPIEIGDNVMFGPRVTVATPMHPFTTPNRRRTSGTSLSTGAMSKRMTSRPSAPTRCLGQKTSSRRSAGSWAAVPRALSIPRPPIAPAIITLGSPEGAQRDEQYPYTVRLPYRVHDNRHGDHGARRCRRR